MARIAESLNNTSHPEFWLPNGSGDCPIYVANVTDFVAARLAAIALRFASGKPREELPRQIRKATRTSTIMATRLKSGKLS